MIELIFIALTAIATISAAIAAWMSCLTSSRALSFQKNYTKNQHLITRLNIIISKLRTLKYMMENILEISLEISDDKFNLIESVFFEVKAELESLGEIGVFDYSSSKISKIPSLGEMVEHIAKNNAYLFEVIDEFEQKISEIFK